LLAATAAALAVATAAALAAGTAAALVEGTADSVLVVLVSTGMAGAAVVDLATEGAQVVVSAAV
jgi:hypothetical protein